MAAIQTCLPSLDDDLYDNVKGGICTPRLIRYYDILATIVMYEGW